MYDQYLAGEMTAVKADEQEVGKMCQAMEEACLKAQKKQLDTLNEIRKMLHSGKSPDELLDMGYSQEDITYVIESEAESKEVAEAETLATVRYIAKLMKNGTSRKELLDMGYKPEFIDFAADMSN
jgi:alcohol dehydrogenase class IV